MFNKKEERVDERKRERGIVKEKERGRGAKLKRKKERKI